MIVLGSYMPNMFHFGGADSMMTLDYPNIYHDSFVVTHVFSQVCDYDIVF